MPATSGIDRVRSLLQHFFNAHDPSVAPEYFTPDLRWHGGSVGGYEGRAA